MAALPVFVSRRLAASGLHTVFTARNFFFFFTPCALQHERATQLDGAVHC